MFKTIRYSKLPIGIFRGKELLKNEVLDFLSLKIGGKIYTVFWYLPGRERSVAMKNYLAKKLLKERMHRNC